MADAIDFMVKGIKRSCYLLSRANIGRNSEFSKHSAQKIVMKYVFLLITAASVHKSARNQHSTTHKPLQIQSRIVKITTQCDNEPMSTNKCHTA